MNTAAARGKYHHHRDYYASSSSSSSSSYSYSSVPSPASASRESYDVFVSFRGEDTRHNITSDLYHALEDRGIPTCIDEKIVIGETITQSLFSAIHRSKIFIAIISRNYGSSTWCLKELAESVKRIQEEGNRGGEIIVLPVFYDVSPSDVRNQTGSFEIAFQRHQQMFYTGDVEGWKKALRMVSKLRGWYLQGFNGVEFMEVIAETVFNDLRNIKMRSHFAYTGGTMGFSASRGNTDFRWQTVNRISFRATYEEVCRPFLVFISHRGPDTKNNFASLLHEDLDKQGLNPFLDKRGIMHGEEIDMVIETAIKECEVGVAIISPNFCKSVNCLDELAMLMECHKKVFPIFFDTKVSDLTLTVKSNGRSFSDVELKRFSCALEFIKKRKGIEFNSKLQDWCDMRKSVVAIVMKMINGDRRNEEINRLLFAASAIMQTYKDILHRCGTYANVINSTQKKAKANVNGYLH